MEEAEKFLNPGSVVTSSKSSALAIPTADHEVGKRETRREGGRGEGIG